MRRKEREIVAKNDIIDVLKRCDTIRIAMKGKEYPYVVPVSFGLEVVDDNAVVYFHCARQGMKLDYLKGNPNVCVEGDIFIQTDKNDYGITTRYESVIGFGKCTFVTENEEILHGLGLIIEHYGYGDYPLERCEALNALEVCKIVLTDITGKRNMPQN